MAIISLSISDTPSIQQHDVLPGVAQPTSQVPRGTATFDGINAIATLAGGNQRDTRIDLDFPTNRHYLLKSLTVTYQADTVEVTSYNAVGNATFNVATHPDGGPVIQLLSEGVANVGTALKSRRTWQPAVNSARVFIDGAAGDKMVMAFADLDAAAAGKVAGDIFWAVDFWIYDQEQVRHWAINTPSPVICF